MPEISVIIPMYNAVETIERAVCSAVQQDEDIEILIVDDQSDDGSADCVEQFKSQYDCSIRVLGSYEKLGVSAARNLALHNAQSEYVAFLDADDLWLPYKLRNQLQVIKESRNIHLVSCDCLRINNIGEVLVRSHDRLPPASGFDAWKALLRYNFIPTPSVLTKKESIDLVGGFREDLLVAEDLDLWLKLGKLGRIEVHEEVLVHYFDYPNSLMKFNGRDTGQLVLDMISGHMLDSDLSWEQKSNILAYRHYELAVQALSRRDRRAAEIHLRYSEGYGFGIIKLAKAKLRYRLISLFQ